MKHPARWLIALALLACALAWWWNLPPPEPVYRGQPLSRWMVARWRMEADENRPFPFVLLGEETHSVGPQAAKWLAYIAEYGYMAQNKPGRLERILMKVGWRDAASTLPPGYNQRAQAIVMLGEMGAAAEPAIPALVRVLKSGPYEHVYAAAFALQQIGPASWPVVEETVAYGPELARCALLFSLWKRLDARFGPVSEDESNKVFSVLTQALHDPGPEIRRNAASSLVQCVKPTIPGPLVDQVAVALWPLSDESNLPVRDAKGKILIYYQDTRPEAVPRLTALLTDPDEAKRNFARSALERLSAP